MLGLQIPESGFWGFSMNWLDELDELCDDTAAEGSGEKSTDYYYVKCRDGVVYKNPYWTDGVDWFLAPDAGGVGWGLWLRVVGGGGSGDTGIAALLRRACSVLERLWGWTSTSYSMRVCRYRLGERECLAVDGKGQPWMCWEVIMHTLVGVEGMRGGEAVAEGSGENVITFVEGKTTMSNPYK